MGRFLFWLPRKGSLRQRILASVSAMVLLSLLSSSMNLYRITEVNRLLEAINHVSIPLGRLFTQMQSDAEVFQRELERCLGQSHWKDPHWKPRPAPRWIEEVLENEMSRVKDLIRSESDWARPEARAHWNEWADQISGGLTHLTNEAARLYSALDQKNEALALEIYPKWTASVDEWRRQLQWGAAEYERSLRQSFSMTESRVVELRTGLEIILIMIVLMSLLLLWLGERALRPLGELTRLARDITRRGLRKEDKSLLPEIPLTRSDEVSQLAREFHHMATALLEREKTVETQKNRLQEQNRLLREMGELNEDILNSINSVLIVTDLQGKITQCNPTALQWLGGSEEEVKGSELLLWPKIGCLIGHEQEQGLERLIKTPEIWKLGPQMIPVGNEKRVYGGHVMPLRQEKGHAHGAIIVLDDLTEEMDLQERLRRAENMAAVGRMSAQVAHEVRNPLHSIGLEAEMAAETAAKMGNHSLRQSLSSILNSVDRLQKITENYLKMSKLSAGRKVILDLGQILESVLATYAPVCEVQGVKVEWTREKNSNLKIWGDPDLLEQVLGNLFKNSLQALEGWNSILSPTITWNLGQIESGHIWIRIQDNGPGIAPEIKDRIFTPFVTTRAQGTGLGLSFIKKVIEDHSGVIRVVETAIGKGACFEILLPQMASIERVKENKEVIHV